MIIETGKSFVDVWTIVHLAFWIFAGSNFWAAKVPLSTSLITGLILAYIWEIFERFAEVRWPSLWLSPEGIQNSYVSDPLTCVIGIVFIYYALNNWR